MKPIAALFVIAVACVTARKYDCSTRTFRVTVAITLELLATNAEVKQNLPNRNDWTRADVAALPCDSWGIALIGKANPEGGPAGILGSTNTGLLTNSKWKCTNQYYDGWLGFTFNDSSWEPAYEAAGQGIAKWPWIVGINTTAKWIWTRKFSGPDRDDTVYCRRKLQYHCSEKSGDND